jgi:transposase-like protein
MEEETVICPLCGSKRNWKGGIRYTCAGEIQRYLCRDCGYRFTPKP